MPGTTVIRRLGQIVATVVVLGAAPTPPASASVLRVLSARDGVVTSGDKRISCGARCSAKYRRGAVVVLHAAPNPNFSFQQWTGACIGAAPTCKVALTRSARVQASFERASGTLNLTVGGPGDVVSDPAGINCGATASQCTGTFEAGSTIRLTPGASGVFTSWGGACGGAPVDACQLLVGGELNALAAFGHSAPEPDQPSLNVTAQGVTVTSSPPGISCPDQCTANFESGTPVTLTAAAPVSWGQACAGALLSCTLLLDASTGVIATASNARRQVGVTVTVSGPGTVTGSQIRCGGTRGTLLDCRALFDVNSTVLLRAKPSKRRFVARWSGFCTGKKRRCTVQATAAKTVTALFRR